MLRASTCVADAPFSVGRAVELCLQVCKCRRASRCGAYRRDLLWARVFEVRQLEELPSGCALAARRSLCSFRLDCP